MKHEIGNEHLKVVVDECGAELKSIQRTSDKREMLWQGDARYWNGQSPILFPTVGNSFQQTIRHKGKSYTMPKHGLVRDMCFTMEECHADSITLSVKSNEDTLRSYPFHFKFSVSYALIEKTLKVTFKVSNSSNEPLFYLLGAHPGFMYDDFHEGDNAHGYLGFDVKDHLTSLGLKPGGFIWHEGAFDVGLDNDGLLSLGNHTFDCDTILDATGRVHECVLYNKEKVPQISMNFDTPLLALWSPNGGCAPFVCIEPWKGCCDENGYVGEFSERFLMNRVEGMGSEECSYSITVH